MPGGGTIGPRALPCPLCMHHAVICCLVSDTNYSQDVSPPSWFRLELMLFLSISETSLVVRMYVVQCNNLLSCFRYRLQPGCLVSILTMEVT